MLEIICTIVNVMNKALLFCSLRAQAKCCANNWKYTNAHGKNFCSPLEPEYLKTTAGLTKFGGNCKLK